MELAPRKHCVMTHVPHIMRNGQDRILGGCVFECMVDRTSPHFRRYHKQVAILDKSIIAITGIYLHLVRFDDLYTPGYLGWYKVHPSVFVDPHGLEYEVLFDQCQMWNYRTGHEDRQAAEAYIRMCEQEAQEDEQRRKELEDSYGNTADPQQAVFARGRFIIQ